MPTSEEEARHSPEYSPGERLAAIEATLSERAHIEQALQEQLDRRMQQAKELFEEKLDGVRREMEAKAVAQKEAVEKAEKSTARQFETFVEADARKGEVTQKRLGALERGESDAGGVRRGANEVKTSTVAWIGAFAAVALVLVAIASHAI